MNILIFPCGSEVGIEIFNSLKNKKGLKLFGASSIKNYGNILFDNVIKLPFIYSPSFDSCLKKAIKKYKIDLMFSCTDEAISIISGIKNLKCKVIGSPKETNDICKEKNKTYNHLKKVICTPKIYLKESVKEYPIFSKPNIGHSGKDCFIIQDEKDLEFYCKKFPNNILLEYLPGEEYTVDCFTNYNRKLIFASARKRVRIVNGISSQTEIIEDKKFLHLAKKINSKLKLNGAWFFQVKENKNKKLVLMEVASRIGGSSTIQRMLGINLAEMSIFNSLRKPIKILKPNKFDYFFERCFQSKTKINIKSIKEIYVDLDDTLIVNNNIDEEIVKSIICFKNMKKKVILLTKHEGDLKKFNFFNFLFDEIIQIDKTDKKIKYMKYNSILIDDSFKERMEARNKNIIVFSNEAVKDIIWTQ
jgi:predicted ATP-grasp superfamily ATP-dependent carboligase